jgi:hypothetical protein
VNRRLTTCAALVAVAALSAVPAGAATKKAKPKPIRGSYHLTTNPNPTMEGTDELPGADSCNDVVPVGVDNHPFTIPAAGTLQVVLQGADPSGGAAPVGPDWDLYLIDSDGSVLDASNGGGAHEETLDKFKKKQNVTIQVCNLLGSPDATVSYTFTYA